MGAGSGQRRRAQQAAAQGRGEDHDIEAWYRFVERLGITDAALGRYYNADWGEAVFDSDQNYQIAQQLFDDFVTAGALTLPLGRKTADYELRLHRSAKGRDEIRIRNIASGDEGTVINDANAWFNRSTRPTSWEPKKTLAELYNAVRMMN
jgi:hypothetical protein